MKWYQHFGKLLLCVAIWLLPASAFAANRYWVGTDGANTNDIANWASANPASCTGGGASVPGSSDVAIFDPDCDSSATVDADLSVLGVNINSGYTGAITQAPTVNITVGTTDWLQSDGTFVTGNGIVTFNDVLTISAGTFTAGAGTIVFAGGSSTLTPGTLLTVANLTINSTGAKTITNSNGIVVTGTLTLTDGTLSQTTIPTAGTIQAQGDIRQASTFDGGTARIEANGTGSQTFSGTATNTVGALPLFVVSKSSGTLTMSGTIRTANNWTYRQGTLDTSTFDSTVVIAGTSITLSGAMIFDNLRFDANTFTMTVAMPASPSVTVNGNLTFDQTGDSGTITINTGTLEVKGDVYLRDALSHTGTATVRISGTSTQILTGVAANTAGGFLNLDINKASGTLTMSGTIRTSKNWIYHQGTIDTTTYDSTVILAANVTLSGAMIFDNLRVDGNSSTTTITMPSSPSVAVNGTFTLDQSGNAGTITINTGTIRAKGNINLPDSTVNHTGTANLFIDGTTDQIMSGNAANGTGGLLQLSINKPSGTLTLSGTIRTSKNWTYSGGLLDAGTSTVIFGAGVISGSHSLNNVRFDNFKTAMTRTISAGTTLTVNGDLTLDQSGNLGAITINTGTIEAKGNIYLPDNRMNHTGTANLYVTGTTDQTLSSNASTSTGGLIALSINKPTGTLTLSGTIRTAKNWTLSGGLLDAGTSTVVYAGNFSQRVTGSHTLHNVTVKLPLSSGVVTSTLTIDPAATLTVNGTLDLKDGMINGGTIDATSNVIHDGSFDGGTGVLRLSGTTSRTLQFIGGDLFPGIDLSGSNTTIIGASTGTVILGGSFSQSAGQFTGGVGNLDIAGNFCVSGGSFTAPSGRLMVGGNFCLPTGTFDANNGTVVLDGSENTTLTLPPLYNLRLLDGLVAYWKFDETSGTAAADSTALANTGTITNSPTFSTDVPALGFSNPGSFSFNKDSNQWVAVTDRSAYHFSDKMTVALWYKVPATHSSFERVVEYGEASFSAINWWLISDVVGSNVYSFAVLDDAGGVHFPSGTPVLTAGSWYHFAGTFDGAYLHFYLNGVEQGTATSYTGTIRPNLKSKLGLCAASFSSGYCNGSLDDVRMYNRAISVTEAVALAAGTEHPASGITYTLGNELGVAGTLTLDNVTLDPNSQTLSYGNLVNNRGTIASNTSSSSSSHPEPAIQAGGGRGHETNIIRTPMSRSTYTPVSSSSSSSSQSNRPPVLRPTRPSSTSLRDRMRAARALRLTMRLSRRPTVTRPIRRPSAPVSTPVQSSSSSSAAPVTPGVGAGYAVKAYALNLRNTPSLTSPVKATLKQSQPVIVLSIIGDYTWAKIRTEKGTEGFVAWKQLKRLP